MNIHAHKISILMPVYNGEKYLKEAIESILNQTYKNFEFLFINDGSTDNSINIAKSYNDKRIKIANSEKNLGLVTALNTGINLASGKYIARMDQDDISLPKRLEIQIKFMESHHNVGLCGTWIKTIGKIPGYVNKKHSDPDDIKASILFCTPLAHPTVMIRKKILDKYNLRYDKNFEYCEDYELWSRISKYTDISNINKVLLLYRMHENNMSEIYYKNKIPKTKIIKINQLKNIKISPNEKELLIHQRISNHPDHLITDFINKKEKWLNKLISQNNKIKYYKEPSFSKVISKQWLTVCSANADNGFWILKKFWKSPLSKNIKCAEEWKQIIKFFIKCLIKKSAN